MQGQWASFYVTMNPKGYIVFSRVTFQRLGEPRAFLLLFDKVNNRIGLKPTALGIKNAYPAAKQGRHGGQLIRAYRLMQEFGIDLPETIRFYDAEIDQDGVLILDLRTARVSSRGSGQKKPVNRENPERRNRAPAAAAKPFGMSNNDPKS